VPLGIRPAAGPDQTQNPAFVDPMKEYKLTTWTELQAPYHRTAYRRMLCDMSHRYVGLQHLVAVSGIGKQEVRQFVAMLDEKGLLHERESHAEPDSIFDTLRPLGGWFVRTFTSELGRR
jgi:hypothetical protein